MSKTIQCPYCSGNVLVKETGKAISSQPLMKQRFSIRNPLPDVTKLLFGNPEKDKKAYNLVLVKVVVERELYRIHTMILKNITNHNKKHNL